MFQKILVAIDQTEVSQQVFNAALLFAQASQAQIMLTQVLSLSHAPAAVRANGLYPSSVDAIQLYVDQVKQIKQQGLQILRQYCDSATQQGVAVQYVQTLGEPGREICKLADSWGASLIVVGRQDMVLSSMPRQPVAWSDRVLGSVCSYVMHYAPTAVLMV
jgi:nucleotide-binding universal stress UspA family protein